VTHLDTSFLVDLLRESAEGNEGPAMALLGRLEEEELAVSVHVVCELQAGAELSRYPEGERARVEALVAPLELVLPDERFPGAYARLLAELRRRGEPISTMDLLIATAAVADGAALVTRNVGEFERVPGLHVLAY
jgi:tRNA(fMet)-specific endonuclease VapC